MISLECKELAREPGTAIVGLFLVVVLALAMWQGRVTYERQVGAIDSAQAETLSRLQASRSLAAQLDESGEQVPYWRDPRDVAGFAHSQLLTYAVKPPQPLQVLNIGQADLYPYYVRLSTDSLDKGVGSHETYNPSALAAGSFDVAFVCIFLLPLLLIAMSAGVGSRERELRMHALIAVATPAPWKVYLRRVALRAALLWLIVAATTASGAVLGVVPAPVGLALAQFLGLVALYLAFWSAVIAVVAFRSVSVGRAALSLCGVWIALLIVVPAVANFTAEQLAPVPSRASFVQEMRDATDAVNRERLRVLEDYFVDHPQYAPASSDLGQLPWTISRVVTLQALEQRVRGNEVKYQAALDHQQALLARFAILSPGLWLQEAFNRLSGTDLMRQRDFLGQVSSYHESLRAFFNPRILALAGKDGYNACVDCEGGARKGDHLDYPRYEYREFRAPVFGTRADIVAFVVLILATLVLTSLARRERAS